MSDKKHGEEKGKVVEEKRIDVSEIQKAQKNEPVKKESGVEKGAAHKETEKEKKSRKALERNINAKIWELVTTGILLRENGYEELYGKICEEFPASKFRKNFFKKRVRRIIWPKIDRDLQEAVRQKLNSLDGVKRIFPYIPDDLILEGEKWHRGLVSGRAKKLMGKALPGIGRIDLSGATPDFKMPKTAFDAPVKIATSDPQNWSVMFLNGADMGVKYTPDIVGNVTRRALSDAWERKDDVVILTNLICMDLKKAGGPAKATRAQIYGDNVNPELIPDPDYRKTVEAILKELPPDRIIYGTPEELLNDLLGGWIKVSTKPADNKKRQKEEPEYKGPVYIVFGMNEKALIDAITYWEIRWWTLQEQKRLRGEIKFTKRAIKEVEKEAEEAFEKDDAELIEKSYEDLREHYSSLESWEYQLAITTVTATRNQEYQRFFDYAQSVVVQKFESAIPNAKIIGQNTSFIEVNGRKIEVNIPLSLRVSDGLLNDYTSCYAPAVLREKIADATVICHPWAIQHRSTGREVDHDGKRDSMKVYVAPIAVDDEFLRSQLDASYANVHPLLKAVYSKLFQPGVLRLRSSNGLIDADHISVKALESFKNYSVKKNNCRGSAVYNRGSKYIWIFNCSDQHWGGRSKEFVTDKKRGMRVGMAEAVFEMMRREDLCKGGNMRVHLFASPDDPTQAQNVAYRTRIHPHQMPYHLIERICNNLLVEAKNSKNFDTAIDTAAKIKEFILWQIEKRGSDYLLEQMQQMMIRHIEANRDCFSAILRRAQDSKLVVKGVGEFVNQAFGGYDTRNIGIVNIGTGDRHFGKTVNFEMAEGPLYSQRLRDLLLGFDEWKNQKDFIDKYVVTPIYGQESIGWGTISIEGKFEYGLELRSAPTNMQGWGDPLRGHVKRDLQRGNYSRIFNGKLPVIKIFGDKHFFSGVVTGHAIYHMSPAAVHTDEYGEFGGFPPNNTGVSFLGIPIDGPDSGPTLWRVLPFDAIKDFVEDNPRSFNWEEFLPNPA